jgi:hypothetical protein
MTMQPRVRLRHGAGPVMIVAVVLLTACGGQADPVLSASPDSDEVFAGTRTEYQRTIFECAQDAGWDVRLEDSSDGTGLEMIVDGLDAQEQVASFNTQLEKCKAQLPPIPEPQTEEEIREFYDHRVTQHGCLVQAGFAPTGTPSFQTFLDAYRAGTLDWDPVYTLAESQISAALKACPPDGDAWW